MQPRCSGVQKPDGNALTGDASRAGGREVGGRVHLLQDHPVITFPGPRRGNEGPASAPPALTRRDPTPPQARREGLQPLRSMFVLVVETLGEAYRLGWRATACCIWSGPNPKSRHGRTSTECDTTVVCFSRKKRTRNAQPEPICSWHRAGELGPPLPRRLSSEKADLLCST